jgi:SPP1 family predicted phage head-tail adaptor
MRAGDLSESVAFDRPTEAADGYGGVVQGWTEVFTCRASFRHERGGETFEAARMSGREVFKVAIRSSVASRQIAPSWRMRDVRRGTPYNVRSVDAVTDRAWIYLLVESGTTT